MSGLWSLLSGWAGFFSLSLHGETLLVLFAAAGFTAVRVAAHRSRRSSFHLSLRDPFQWAEAAFFSLVLLKGLAG